MESLPTPEAVPFGKKTCLGFRVRPAFQSQLYPFLAGCLGQIIFLGLGLLISTVRMKMHPSQDYVKEHMRPWL